ncbi:MAG: cell division protein FtsH, partial [Chloroflexi bacterium]|nr:cell division protein FtsH [Chloroflexota bacterium]
IFLGREISEQRDYGEEIASAIDREIKALVDKAYDRARQVLVTNRETLDRIAHRLIEEETLDADQFHQLLEAPLAAPEDEGEPVIA